jgi:hypothetical protein
MSVMHDVLRDRVMRHLEALPEEQLYQVMDYIEFLSSKYNRSVRTPNGIQRFGELLEDKMRQQGLAFGTIRGALGVVGTAGRVVSGITDAGRSVISEVGSVVSATTGSTPPQNAGSLPPQAPPAQPAPSSDGGVFGTAGRLMSGLTEAGRSVLKEMGGVVLPTGPRDEQNGAPPAPPSRRPDGDPQSGPPAP